MKTIIFYLLILSLMVASRIFAGDTTNQWGVGQWGAETNHVQLLINLKDGRRDIKINSPYSLWVCIVNHSTNEVFYSGRDAKTITDPYDGLACVVISPSGKDISPKQNRGVGWGSELILRPNQGGLQFEFDS